MKQSIHPAYYPSAKVRCACGNEFATGSTMPEINVEICSNCHPFYTGKDKFLDTRGRLEKFKKRLEKSSSFASSFAKSGEEHGKVTKGKQTKKPVKAAKKTKKK